MLHTLKSLLPTMILFCLLDYLWIGVISRQHYVNHLGHYLNLQNGQLAPSLLPAVIVYCLFAIMIAYVVIPLSGGLLSQAFFYGGLLGFIVYGIYDMTNMAVMKDWPIHIAILDWCWGTFLCSVTSGCCAWLKSLLH